MNFPVYVKYTNNKHFFKIESFDKMQELSLFTNAYSLTNFKAKTFVDRNVISDLLELSHAGVASSSEEEFERQLMAVKDLKQL